MIPMVDLQRQYREIKTEIAGCRHVYHQFTLRAKNREKIAAALRENHISSAVYYPVPLHRQEVFTVLPGVSRRLPVAESCAAECLSIPMFPELTEDEITRISNVINHAS